MTVRRGRPNLGIKHIDRLHGSELARERLRIVLQTLTGEMSVEDACSVLGIGHSRFAVVREEALQGAINALEPRAPGRPRKQPGDLDPDHVAELEARNQELEEEVVVAHVKEELAHILARPGPSDGDADSVSPPSSMKAGGKRGRQSNSRKKRKRKMRRR